MNQSAYTEHMAEIIYRKITGEEEYQEHEDLDITSDSVFKAICKIIKHLSDIPGLRERIEELS